MYFNWTKYPFTPAPELRGAKTDVQVAIVGAGPVGLAAALGLGQMGVNVVLLEAADQVSDGSRALSLDRQSMRLLDRLGVGDEFSARSIPRVENLVYYKQQLVYRMAHGRPPGDKHFDFNILQQCWMEQILLDRLAAFPNVDLRWHSRVTHVENGPDGVSLAIDTPEGAYTLAADYVVAADGGRGVTRRLMGLEYESATSENISDRRFVICDFTMETELSKARRFYLDPPYKPNGVVLLHAEPFDTWRLDYAMEDDEDPEYEASPERIAQRLDEHMAMMGEKGPWKILWTSVYRPRAVTLGSYREGRVLFAGDAAHQTPIFGGRGLNLGFADVGNLVWKLGLVLAGKAGDGLLDSYDRERRQMARKTLSDLSGAAVFMAHPTAGVTLMRDAVLDLIPHEPFVRDFFDAHRARKREGYSPTNDINDDPLPGLHPGNPLPNPLLRNAAGDERHLYDLLGRDFTAIHVAGTKDDAAPSRRTPSGLGSDLPTHHLTIVQGEPADGAWSRAAGPDRFSDQAGRVLLVRPDCYIASNTSEREAASAAASIARTLGLRESQAAEPALAL